MKAVLDTNAIVSGLLTARRTCSQILDLLVDGLFQLCANDRILDEYEQVLLRPELGIAPADAEAFLELVRSVVQPASAVPMAVELPDETDRPFLEVAAAADALLVTGNPRHFPKSARRGVNVVSPGEYLELLRRAMG